MDDPNKMHSRLPEEDDDKRKWRENKLMGWDKTFPFIKEYDDDDDPIWTTGKGKYVKLSQMTDLHVINTLKCWLGLGKTVPPKGWCGGKTRWVRLLTNELERRAHAKRRDN